MSLLTSVHEHVYSWRKGGGLAKRREFSGDRLDFPSDDSFSGLPGCSAVFLSIFFSVLGYDVAVFFLFSQGTDSTLFLF